MNYEDWQNLWARQPVPAAPSEHDRLMDEIRTVSAEQDSQWRQFERGTFIAILFFLALNIFHVIDHGFDLTDWLHLFLWLSWGIVAVVFRWRRHTMARLHGEALLDRIEHAQHLLRETIQYSKWLVAGTTPVAAFAIGLMVADITEGESVFFPLLAAFVVLLIPLFFLRHQRRHYERLRQRIAELDQLREGLLQPAP